MSQNEQDDPAATDQKKATRSFLLNPVVLAIEAVLIVCFAIGVTMSYAQPKDYYTGTAKVISFTDTAKHCWVDIEHDGIVSKRFEMTRATCGEIAKGDVIEIVRGKYLPEKK